MAQRLKLGTDYLRDDDGNIVICDQITLSDDNKTAVGYVNVNGIQQKVFELRGINVTPIVEDV